MGMDVVCGPFEGTGIVVFQGYFAKEKSEKDPDGVRYSERQQQAAGMFKGFFNGLRVSRGELMEDLRDIVLPLPSDFEYGDNGEAVEDVTAAMEWLTEYLPDKDGYLKIKDNKNNDFQSYRFVEAKDSCECIGL